MASSSRARGGGLLALALAALLLALAARSTDASADAATAAQHHGVPGSAHDLMDEELLSSPTQAAEVTASWAKLDRRAGLGARATPDRVALLQAQTKPMQIQTVATDTAQPGPAGGRRLRALMMA